MEYNNDMWAFQVSKILYTSDTLCVWMKYLHMKYSVSPALAVIVVEGVGRTFLEHLNHCWTK